MTGATRTLAYSDRTLFFNHGCRAKEREVNSWMETASQSSRELDAAEAEAQRAREGAKRLEAEVQRLAHQLHEVEGAYK